MLQISWYMMVSTLFLLIAAVGCYVAALTVQPGNTRAVKEAALVGAGTWGDTRPMSCPRPAPPRVRPDWLTWARPSPGWPSWP